MYVKERQFKVEPTNEPAWVDGTQRNNNAPRPEYSINGASPYNWGEQISRINISTKLLNWFNFRNGGCAGPNLNSSK